MAGEWLDKIKDFAKGNPDKADSAIEKVEDLIDQRTGGRYADQVDKGGDILRDKLGLPPQGLPADPEPGPGSSPEPPPASQDSPVPAPNPSPGTGDPEFARPVDAGSPADVPTTPEPTDPDADPLPQGGPTQQGEPQPVEPAPGGDQPDSGGPVRS
ncbi:Rv0909 family putative TA system antitoxin [Pedococcus sp. NPDC057267]|uniref:antitoxin n=1 Tax=Pedococcus sp. NPDC057267 TaxID=3346077 RepID=UPI00362A9EC4